MKKLIILSLFVSVALVSSAQAFYLGASFTGKSTWLLNKAVFDRGASQDIRASFGNDYGIVGGISFNDGAAGIEVNFLFNTFSQKYDGTDDLFAGILDDYTSESVYHSLDIPILFKTGSEGAYFEIGPVVSFINQATFSLDYDNKLLTDIEEADYLSFYNGTNIGAILGFGGNINVSDNLLITLGLRFYYGITDIGGVNAFGWDKEKTEQKDAIYLTEENHYGHEDFKTNPLSGGLKVGLIYVIE